MSSKLSFKGDAPKKKKRKTVKTVLQLAEEQIEEQLDGWIPLPSASLALGPLYLTRPASATASTPSLCLALQPTTQKIFAHPLPSSASLAATTSAATDLDAEDLEALVLDQDVASLGPQDVHHVFVCTRIQDTDDRVTFRSARGRYLASDESGVVSADREARGIQEEWTLTSFENDVNGNQGVKVQSSYGKYLVVDLVAGGKLELRADEDKVEEGDGWQIYMQGEFLSKAKKAQVERSGVKGEKVVDGLVIRGSMAGAENEFIQKYQARGQGRLVSSVEDVKELKRAREEGNLAEKLLDRRSKLKSDRYC